MAVTPITPGLIVAHSPTPHLEWTSPQQTSEIGREPRKHVVSLAPGVKGVSDRSGMRGQ